MLHEAILLVFCLSTFVLAQREDVVLLCRERHLAAFCNRLGSACSELTNTPIPQQMVGDEYVLPMPISRCIASEYYLAICYVEYSPKWCNAWKEECGVQSPIGQFTEDEKQCIENKKFIAVCNARYGSENCATWVTGCKIPSMNGNLALGNDGRTCITTQWVLLTCTSTFGQEFCIKLEQVCCSMYGISVPQGTFHVLPEVVTKCISSENFVAVCYAKYGRGQCQAWMQECRITSSPAQLTDSERKCMESSMFISMCYNDYGAQKCLGWSKICNAVDAFGKISLGDSGKDCMRTRDPIIMCKAKYGPVYCNRLGSACSELTGIPIPEQMAGNMYKLPDRILTCVASEYFMAICYARYGADECNVWKKECNVKSPVDKLTPDEQQCMESKRVLQICLSTYGLEFCTKIEASCIAKVGLIFPNDPVHILPASVTDCISSENTLQLMPYSFAMQSMVLLSAADLELLVQSSPIHPFLKRQLALNTHCRALSSVALHLPRKKAS
ncbi:unnamed protein product [Anisakis simplex]|uniref:GDNF family receptor alpha-like n=1 Tax=Anisakis simplex TaxID=6269 RepID=A0A0M3K285_ANISI|nr:unnamed protein product [Anisakis simplex]